VAQGRKTATTLIDVQREPLLNRELAARISAGPEGRSAGGSLRTVLSVLATAVCYYVATQVAWALCFPDSKVSLFFPPHAVLASILLLVPTRRWWAYTLAAASAHFLATQQAHWPTAYALHCEVFDALQNVGAAAGIRMLINSPLEAITLRDAIVFVLIAVVLVPFGTAFWGASFTVSYGFGTHYWIEWRNLGVSNAVTAVVLMPAFLLGAHHLFVRRPRAPSPRRALEAVLVGVCMVALGIFVFDKTPAGANTSPALLYTPIPLLIWAALRFGLGGISASMFIMTFLAIWGTMHGHGPFLAQTPAENATALQLFLLVTAAPLMLLAVVIDEERRTADALRQSYEQNQDLGGRLINAQEDERARIARDLHDDLTQQLAGVAIMLTDLKRNVGKPGAEAQVEQTVTALEERTASAATTVRNLSHELHPGVLEYLGLTATLRGHCADIERHHQVTVTFKPGDGLDSLDSDVALCLFRVVQEALTNVLRHARARKACVTLTTTAESVELNVVDDGVGFVADERTGSGLGLRSIHERVRFMRGSVRVDSRPGEGTTVLVRIPIGAAHHELAVSASESYTGTTKVL
jgi:two-component system sensor histidine kinase UhpB